MTIHQNSWKWLVVSPISMFGDYFWWKAARVDGRKWHLRTVNRVKVRDSFNLFWVFFFISRRLIRDIGWHRLHLEELDESVSILKCRSEVLNLLLKELYHYVALADNGIALDDLVIRWPIVSSRWAITTSRAVAAAWSSSAWVIYLSSLLWVTCASLAKWIIPWCCNSWWRSWAFINLTIIRIIPPAESPSRCAQCSTLKDHSGSW